MSIRFPILPQWPFQHYFQMVREILRDTPLQERIKHLLKFAECIDDKLVYRFASHPRFLYWAFNMIQRKHILQQSGIFLKQNPGEAHLTIDELREMADSNANADNANLFLSKISRYVGNIAGTNTYWNRVRDELKAIIINVGPLVVVNYHLLLINLCIILNHLVLLVAKGIKLIECLIRSLNSL